MFDRLFGLWISLLAIQRCYWLDHVAKLQTCETYIDRHDVVVSDLKWVVLNSVNFNPLQLFCCSLIQNPR